jgi:hypothetical protein
MEARQGIFEALGEVGENFRIVWIFPGFSAE